MSTTTNYGTTEKAKPPLPERKYIHEPFRVEPIIIISENDKPDEQMKSSSGQLITPSAAYQGLGIQPFSSAPQLKQQTLQYHIKIQPYEIPQTKQPTAYEITQPTTTNQNPLIPTVKRM